VGGNLSTESANSPSASEFVLAKAQPPVRKSGAAVGSSVWT